MGDHLLDFINEQWRLAFDERKNRRIMLPHKDDMTEESLERLQWVERWGHGLLWVEHMKQRLPKAEIRPLPAVN